jgi:hypothetical protein
MVAIERSNHILLATVEKGGKIKAVVEGAIIENLVGIESFD